MKKLALVALCLLSTAQAGTAITPRQYFNWLMTDMDTVGLGYYIEPTPFCDKFKALLNTQNVAKVWDVLQYTRSGAMEQTTKAELEDMVKRSANMYWDGASWKGFRTLNVASYPGYDFYVTVSGVEDDIDLTSICVAVVTYPKKK